MSRKHWLLLGALGAGTALYLAVPFAYVLYLFPRLPAAETGRADTAYMLAYGWLVGPCRDNPYSHAVRRFTMHQCKRHPGHCIPPAEENRCGA